MIVGSVWVVIVTLVPSREDRSRGTSTVDEDRYRSRPADDVYSTDEPANEDGALPWSTRVSCCDISPLGKLLVAVSVPVPPAMDVVRCPAVGLDVSYAKNWPVAENASYSEAFTWVASTIPATTVPAAIRDEVIADAAMFAVTMVPAMIVADASNLNGTHEDPFHWEISPVVAAIQMSLTFGAAGATVEIVIAVPPNVWTVIPLD